MSERLAFLHTRFGTPSRAIDVAAAATILIMFVSGGRVAWLAHAYAIAIVATLGLKIAALVRLRRLRPATRPFQAPFNLHVGTREIPLGLLASTLLVGAGAAAMIVARDPPAIATFALMGSLLVLFTGVGRETLPPAVAEDPDVFDILPAAELSLDQMDVRPGGVLVLVRNPHALAHVAAALQRAGDRDVVVMTVRLLGVDVERRRIRRRGSRPPPSGGSARRSRRWPSGTTRPVRLLIVPAHDVFDAVVATIVRLQSSEVHVGESETLSADDQARLLGDAWERAPKPEPLDVRLVVHHASGRTDAYHLGAHPPALNARRPRPHSPPLARRRQGRRTRTCTTTTSSGRHSRKWNSN